MRPRHDDENDAGRGSGKGGRRGGPRGPHGFRGGAGWRGGGGWRGRPGPPPPGTEDLDAWLTGRLPGDWFTGVPQVTVDREEILVVGTLDDVDTSTEGDETATGAARTGRISRFREDTRDRRIAIAREAEGRYGRSIAWGVRIGDTEELFTTLAVPVMTRLRQDERAVLDTLIDAGVARSRSEALAWCVHLVGSNADDWLGQLRDALTEVQRLREEGPAAD